LVLFLAGCAPFTAVGGKLAFSQQGFEVDLPQEWYQAREVGDTLLVTRDGLLLQPVRIDPRVCNDCGVCVSEAYWCPGQAIVRA